MDKKVNNSRIILFQQAQLVGNNLSAGTYNIKLRDHEILTHLEVDHAIIVNGGNNDLSVFQIITNIMALNLNGATALLQAPINVNQFSGSGINNTSKIPLMIKGTGLGVEIVFSVGIFAIPRVIDIDMISNVYFYIDML
jgi:hypothetical protein